MFCFIAKQHNRDGSVERLKVRRRCGWRRWAPHIRCTARKLVPTALAMAQPHRVDLSRSGPEARPPWLPAGAACRVAATLAQEAVNAFFAIAPLPATDRRPADAHAAGDLQNCQPLCRQ